MTKYSKRTLSKSDDQLLAELGKRLAAQRIQMDSTQAELANQAGIGKRTLERLEAGNSVQLVSLIRVLRAMDMLDSFEMIAPEFGLRPFEVHQGRSSPRQRVSRKRSDKTKPWTWGDDT